MFELIDQKKKELDALRPFPSAVAARLREFYLVEWTHHSTALEGNTLTLMETRVVLEGITVGGKTLREHLEIIDHKDAIEYVEEYVREDIPLTETFIRDVHRLVLKSTFPDAAGRYRTGNVVIAGSKHRPPEGFQVPVLMKNLVEDFNIKWSTRHPVERAAWLHWKLTHIHPFIDGNGRTARLLMNFVFMREGYPPVIFKKEERERYLTSLEEASVAGNMVSFLELVRDALLVSLEIFLSVVRSAS